MGSKSVAKTDRNLEFYKRWIVKKEPFYRLLVEYSISQSRAYQIKKWVEKQLESRKLKMT